MKKINTTFVAPSQFQKEPQQQIASDNYGLRGKSKWVSEAIHNFLKTKHYCDMVNLGDELHGFEKNESITLDQSTKILLDEAVLAIRTKYPLLEGVQSRIIRTSILQRLLQS